ncbi:MAG: phasin family protein [Polaromonas sp.]
MNARVPDTAPDNAAQAPWNLLTEFGRQQLAVAAQSASAIYRAREVIRAVQQQAAHEASVRHAQTARKLCAPCAPGDFLALQSELIRDNIQGASQYWQQLSDVAMQTQLEMMAHMSHVFDGEAGIGLKSVLQAFQAATPPLISRLFALPQDSAKGSR